MSEGISSCRKTLDKSTLSVDLINSVGPEDLPFEEPSEDSKTYGLESHFNENVVFYKNVTIHGEIKSKFTNNLVVNQLTVVGVASFLSPVDFYEGVYVDKGVNAGVVTARDNLSVGCGGTVLTANGLTGRVGIASTNPQQALDVKGTVIVSERIGIGSNIPQQKLDVAGSIKIDETIYDSANVPGQNGYYLVRDQTGVRWIPLIADSVPGVPGIATEGVFVLNEMVPLYP